jgi:hypothetical protein
MGLLNYVANTHLRDNFLIVRSYVFDIVKYRVIDQRINQQYIRLQTVVLSKVEMTLVILLTIKT